MLLQGLSKSRRLHNNAFINTSVHRITLKLTKLLVGYHNRGAAEAAFSSTLRLKLHYVYLTRTESVLDQRVVTSLQMCRLLREHTTRLITQCSLSPPTGASQADRGCGEQRYVPAAHHLQRLQSCQVMKSTHTLKTS